ncbi:MAG TPA: hypothetical protein VI837_00380 [Blastocatellia bacterium]|nr:hypothetical protein [Blastocatellia bacterium]
MTRPIRLRILFLLAVVCLSFESAGSAQTPKLKADDEPFVADYYYKAKWGYADEFITLFKKNHFPVLKKQMESGRILSVTALKPRYHATEDGRWDYRVTIVFKNAAVANDPSGEEAIIKRLFPDQETYKREEQRRFEILLAHWDVPVVSVDLTK